MPIHVICRTNLDAFAREAWPKEMACRPVVGDRVESTAGKVLQVVGVTHCMVLIARGISCPYPEPGLRVELSERPSRP